MKHYFECTECWVWSKEPFGFNEKIHFVECPKCRRTMYKTVGSPTEGGMKATQEVSGYCVRQRLS